MKPAGRKTKSPTAALTHERAMEVDSEEQCYPEKPTLALEPIHLSTDIRRRHRVFQDQGQAGLYVLVHTEHDLSVLTVEST